MVNTKLVYVAAASVGAVAIAVVILQAIGNSQQPRISILNQNIEPAVMHWDNHTLIADQVEYRDYWTGNRTANVTTIITIGSYTFDYEAKEPGFYEIYLVNEWQNSDPVFISLKYDAPQRNMMGEMLSIPYNSSMQFIERMEAGERIRGNFNVTGHPDQGILFYLILPKCTQSISFSFVLANTGQYGRSASVELAADGAPVWSNGYLIESGKLAPDRGTASIDDCWEHSYKLLLM